MENPNRKWMRTGGTMGYPYFRKRPNMSDIVKWSVAGDHLMLP